MTNSSSQSKKQSRRHMRRLFFHLLTVGVVLAPLFLVEAVFRLCVTPPPPATEDPYVSFSGSRPLFQLNAEGTRWQTASNRLTYFYPQSFSARKDPQALRIFCLGGSTVQGRPYGAETSFSTWLLLNLQAALPGRDIEVVNAGGVSYASYRLRPILEEVLGHQPDLIILYMGHNEFLEDRTYRPLKRVPRLLVRLHRVCLELRTYAWADAWITRARSQVETRPLLPAEVEATLDRPQGLDTYQRDPVWRNGIIEHFQHNLAAMIRLTRAAHVPLILVNPVVNIRDCPPFKSQHSDGLSDRNRTQVEAWRQQARGLDWSRTREKTLLLEKAAQLDPRHAGLLYLIGQCHLRLNHGEQARSWLERAKEEDVCPLRILTPMQQIILNASERHALALVDMNDIVSSRSESGLPGDAWLLDHVHLSIEGHQLLADHLMDTLTAQGLIQPAENWRALRDPLWQAHFLALDDLYFARGQARLKSLQMWSRGTRPEKD
jgi:lysophospholipase L1-like esterase